jgi:hypothetical protein
MSRTIILLVSIAACGSYTPSPTTPTTTTTTPTTTAATAPTTHAPKPDETPPPEPVAPKAPMHDRLRDVDGPIAGLPGFSLKRTPSTSHCGGIKVTTTRAGRVAPADARLVAVLWLEFPSGLSFDPDPAKKAAKEASLKRFSDFVRTLTKTGADAAQYYGDQIKGDDATKSAAFARLAQVQLHLASVMARAEIPKDVRTGEFKDEKISAYCDKMVEVAEPVLVQAEAALANCSTFVKKSTATGWWNEVCGSK